MLKAERQDRIVEMCRVRGTVSVHEIATTLGVSDMTVRRDLEELSDEGRIERLRGGAKTSEGVRDRALIRESAHLERQLLHIEEKTKIAKVAGGTWPGRVRHLIEKDIDRLAKEREDGLNNLPPRAMLLPDLLKVFNGRGDFLSTIDILTALANIAPERWGIESPYGTPITRQRLAKMLSPMGIHSVQTPGRENRTRGYRKADVLKVAREAHMIAEPESSGE